MKIWLMNILKKTLIFVMMLEMITPSQVGFASSDEILYENYANTQSDALVITKNQGLTSQIVQNAGFDSSDNPALYIHGIFTESCVSDKAGKNYTSLNFTKINNTSYKKFTVKFDFKLTENNTSIAFRGRQHNAGVATNMKLTAGKDVPANTWNRAALVMGADGIDNTYKIYLNGKEYVSGATSEESYGFAEYGWLLFLADKDQNYGIYLDNITVSAGDIGYNGETNTDITSISSNAQISDNNILYYQTINKVSDLDISSTDAQNIFYYNSSFEQISADDDITNAYAVALVSKNGLYNYYFIKEYTPNEDSDSYFKKNIKFTLNNTEQTATVKTSQYIYDISCTDAEFEIVFDQNIDQNSVKNNNVYIEDIQSSVTAYQNSIIISCSELKPLTEYKVHLNNIIFESSVADNFEFSFVTSNDNSQKSEPMSELTLQSSWQKYGNLGNLSTDENGNTASGREGYYSGVMQKIPFDTFSKLTGDKPGDSSVYNLNYNISLNKDQSSPEALKLIFKWVKEVEDSNGNLTEEYITTNDFNTTSTYSVQIDDSVAVNKDITLNIPKIINENTDNAYLKIIIQGIKEQKLSSFSDFTISNFSLKKYSKYDTINLTIDDTKTIRSVDNSILGYSFEGAYWHSDDEQAVVPEGSNQFKQEFITKLKEYTMPKIRIGGYSTNYEFWKANLGSLENRIPTYQIAPEWSNQKYWRKDIEYIGTYERLKLAEAFGGNNEIIMCANIFSALPADTDYNKKYKTPITPEFVVDNLGNINYDVLDRVTRDLLDLIAFCTVDATDTTAPRIEWAQKRVELGHPSPFNVTLWELGNELYLRGISGENYVKICNYIIEAVKKEFPDVELAVNVKPGYSDWLEYIINSLGTKINYITTHNYYGYYSISNSIAELENIETAIANSKNPNLKYLITEGGLSTFQSTYTGPSNTSLAMCTSFADYINRISKFSNLDSFQYFGSAIQLCYSNYGWKKSGSKASVTDNNEKNGVQVSGRSYWADGVIQEIPLTEFLKNNHTIGTTKSYNISYDIKFTANTTEPFEVKFEWYDNENYLITAYSRVFENYNDGEWNSITSDTKDITIPSSIENKKTAYLKISVVGAKNSGTNTYADIEIKNLNLLSTAGENLVNNQIANIYTNTALSNLMKKYSKGLNGNIILTETDNKSSNRDISTLAVKNNSTVYLFVSNLSEQQDYKININSSNQYIIKSKYTMNANDIYSERNLISDDIYEIYEEFTQGKQSLKSLNIPKHSVSVFVIENCGNKPISEQVSFEKSAVKIAGNNSSKSASLIAVFYDSNNSIINCIIKPLEENKSFEYEIPMSKEYSALKLFKWDTTTLFPLATKEIYTPH